VCEPTGERNPEAHRKRVRRPFGLSRGLLCLKEMCVKACLLGPERW